MILKSIIPHNIGPYVIGSKLLIEPKTTVITGANDVGKSIVLRALEFLGGKQSIEEHEVNRDRMGECEKKWQEDSEIYCDAEFEVTELDTDRTTGGNYPVGTILNIRKSATQKIRRAVLQHTLLKNARSNSGAIFDHLPRILVLPLKSRIRQAIDIKNLTEAEGKFLRVGMGNGFSAEQFLPLSEDSRTTRWDEAEEKINDKLKSILSSKMKWKFKLKEGLKPEIVNVSVVDAQKCYTPLESRGLGFRRIVDVMGALLQLKTENSHTLVVYDEPETSLHSDAQHMLRRLLETIGEHPNVQVIYTTHSPAMINRFRPHAVRIVERKRHQEKASSFFNNQAYVDNYALVRESLGINAADSLLYAPITIVVEGRTEVSCIPLILRKLVEANKLKNDVLEPLFSQALIVDGGGDSFVYMCKLVKAQGANPIVFLDGDKRNEANSVKEKHPDVPIILLDPSVEIENTVPVGNYIHALSALLGDSGISEANFKAWEQRTQPRQRMISKKVERWIEEDFSALVFPSKLLLMEKAIEETDPTAIEAERFIELVRAMESISNRISTQ